MKKMELFVEGMTCSSCVAKVEHALKKVEDVKDVHVSLFDGKVKIEAEESLEEEKIYTLLDGMGYSAQSKAQSKAQVKAQNKAKSKSENKTVNKAQRIKPTRKMMSSALAKKRVPLTTKEEERQVPENKIQKKTLNAEIELSLTLITGALLFYFSMGHMLSFPLPAFFKQSEGALVLVALQWILTTVILYLQKDMLKSGLKALKFRSPNMHSLVALGSLAAFVYSNFLLFPFLKLYFTGQDLELHRFVHQFYFEAAGTILVLMRLGKYLEEKGKNKAKSSLKALVALREHKVKVEQGTGFVWKDFEDIEVGDVLYMELGSRLSVDGVIVQGQGSIDTSSYSGESLPSFVEVGDEMKAGALVVSGFFKVKATQVGEDSSLSRMIARVLQATESKTAIARLADKISLYFVPTILTLALLGFGYWWINASFAFALKTAIMVLIISCPCALGLAAPLAIMVGTGRAAKEGILYKNAEKMEESQKLEVLILDKTGTLTEGKMKLKAIFDFEKESLLETTEAKLDLLRKAAFIEQSSQHPLSKAIFKALEEVEKASVSEESFKGWLLEDFEESAGLGVKAKINGKAYALGNKKHILADLNVSEQEKLKAIESRYSKEVLLYFIEEGQLSYIFMFKDELKANAKEVIARLEKRGITCVLASGDRESQVREVAESLGVKHFYSECMPEFKHELVKSYQNQGKRVAMVGDGINDAAALAQADLSIVMGEGAEISLDTADVILLKNDLEDLEKSLKLSQAVLRNIKQNLFWAFIYNVIFIPVALGVFYYSHGLQLETFMAAIAMSLSDLFVIVNALRLNYTKI